MGHGPVRTASASDRAAAIDTIVLAFAADPVVRWCWPDARAYLEHMPGFTQAFCGAAFVHDSAYCMPDFAGAALWLPPGVHGDEAALGEIVERTLSPEVQNDMNGLFEQMSRHHPDEPHWYLPMIGVAPAHQGKGCGAALMAYALERCDRERLAAYLESTNPRNITLYERHGFVKAGLIQSGSSPPIVPMVRRARTA